MDSYTVKDNALLNGSIADNYNFLFEAVNNHKTRFIRSHLEVLYKYGMLCGRITEMGVDGVNSTWAFLLSDPVSLTSIDIQNTKAPQILNLAEQLANDNGIEFTFIQEDTLKVSIEPTDMLFIDTDHTYEQLKQELQLHADKVSTYIAFHDTIAYPSMTRAITEFLEQNSTEWEFKYESKESCGLMIIKRIVG